MKKTILAVLMVVIVSTPCFAQEGESIEGTIWEVLPIGLRIFPTPGIWIPGDLEFGFYDGKVYQNLSPIENSSYEDRLGFIVFSTANSPVSTQAIGDVVEPLYFGILQPTGMGIVVEGHISLIPPGLFIKMGLLVKTGDTWIPPEVE
jgi:hypothetical protein